MRTEALAIAIAVIMIASAMPLYSHGAEGATGDSDDPDMILWAGNTYRDSDDRRNVYTMSEDETVYVSLNLELFNDTSVTATASYYRYAAYNNNRTNGDWDSTENETTILGDGAENPSCNGSILFEEMDSDGGLYKIVFKNKAPGNAGKYLIKIKFTVTETYGEASLSQDYYFGANVIYDITDGSTTLSSYVCLTDESEPAEDSTFYTSLSFNHEDDVGPLYACVQLEDGSYVRDGYYYYAVGLPDGVNMKLNGVIEGHIAGYITSDTEFTIYAINESFPSDNAS